MNPIPAPSPFKGKGDCVTGGKGLDEGIIFQIGFDNFFIEILHW